MSGAAAFCAPQPRPQAAPAARHSTLLTPARRLAGPWWRQQAAAQRARRPAPSRAALAGDDDPPGPPQQPEPPADSPAAAAAAAPAYSDPEAQAADLNALQTALHVAIAAGAWRRVPASGVKVQLMLQPHAHASSLPATDTSACAHPSLHKPAEDYALAARIRDLLSEAVGPEGAPPADWHALGLLPWLAGRAESLGFRLPTGEWAAGGLALLQPPTCTHPPAHAYQPTHPPAHAPRGAAAGRPRHPRRRRRRHRL